MLIGANVSFRNGHPLNSVRLPHISGLFFLILKKWQFNFTFVWECRNPKILKEVYMGLSHWQSSFGHSTKAPYSYITKEKKKNNPNSIDGIFRIAHVCHLRFTHIRFNSRPIARYFPCRDHARMKKEKNKCSRDLRSTNSSLRQQDRIFFSSHIFD